jgi:hypothetical protein
MYVLKEDYKCPVNEVFESRLKDIPTFRFSKNFDDNFGELNWTLKYEAKKLKFTIPPIDMINKDELRLNSYVSWSDRAYPTWSSIGDCDSVKASFQTVKKSKSRPI